jgi:hypothetical protein
MFMQFIFVVCGDVADGLPICCAKLSRKSVRKSGRWFGDGCETGDCEDRLQQLRFDDLQVESPRRGQVDKSFVNRGIRNLSNCSKRKKLNLI